MPNHPRLEEFLSCFTIRRASGGSYSAICPTHDDKQASLSITEGASGIVLHCHANAGCTTESICDAIGWTVPELFYDYAPAAQAHTKKRERKPAKADSANCVSKTKGAPKSEQEPEPEALPFWQRIETVYPYVDADGVLLYENCRLHSPKSFAQRRPDPDHPHRHVWNLKDTPLVPYQLPLVRKAIADGVAVFIVEGEKDVGTLKNHGIVATTNAMGAGKWREAYNRHFDGAEIYIIPDNDVPGCLHAMDVACSLTPIASAVYYVQFPDLPVKGDVSDWFSIEGNTREKFLDWVMATRRRWTPGTLIEPSAEAIAAHEESKKTHASDRLREHSDLPIINVTNRQQRDITAEAIAALEANQSNNRLFIRTGRLIRLRTRVSSEINTPYIDDVTPDIMRNLLSHSANFVRVSSEGDERNSLPPVDTARDVLARGQWEFPQLDAVTESPVMRPDGSILTDPGYDAATHLFYVSNGGLALPEIPESPSSSDVVDARERIDDILHDFPFVADADKANLIAMMLTQVIRPAIDGLIPMGIINAPQPGSGKGLLIKVISLIATGKVAPATTAPTTPDEWTKQLTAILAGGATMIVFDNVETVLDSPDLASFLTAAEWKARILGQSKVLSIPNRATTLVTGNNVRVGGDIARRCYWSTINPNTSTPELRKGFRYANLCKHVLDNRGEILAALFTFARSWFAAGQPDPTQSPIVGSFDEWSRVIGGIIEHVEYPDFLANAEEIRAASDVSSSENEVFLNAIYMVWQNLPFTVKELNTEIGSNTSLADCVPDYLLVARDKSEASFVRSCGKLFSRIVGRRYGESNTAVFRSTVMGKGSRTKWFVECDDADTNTALPKPNDSEAAWIS